MMRETKFVAAFVFLLTIPLLPQASPGPYTALAGAYRCSLDEKGSANEVLFLTSDGRWSRGQLFDPTSFRLTWTRVQTRSYKGRLAFLERVPHSRGLFRVGDSKLVLQAFEPGVVFKGGHSGGVSRFEPTVPDAYLVHDRSFIIDSNAQTLTEILPFNAKRELVRCRSGAF